MDLIAARGAAPPPQPARDRETPDRAHSGERENSRNGFDEALGAAAPSSPPSPSEDRAAATVNQRQAHEPVRRFEKEAAQAAIESEIVIEPPLIEPLPGALAAPIVGVDTAAPQAQDDVVPPRQTPEPSPDDALPAAIAPTILAGDIARDKTADGDAVVARNASSSAANVRTGDDNLTSESSPLAERIRSAIASEDKTVRPEAMLRPEKGKAAAPAQPITAPVPLVSTEASTVKAAAAPSDQPAPPTLNAALIAALKDLPPADLTAETVSAGLLESLSKAETTLSAPDAARLLEKLRVAPQTPATAEIAAVAYADSAPQMQAAPKLEILQHQPHLGALDAARQVIAAIRTDAKGDTIEVRLDPPELGRVRIHFTMDRPDSVTAIVTTDRSDTLDTMRRHASDLAKELSRAGFANVELQFKSGGERSHSDDAPRSQFAGRIADEKAAEPANFIYARARLDGRLDRLV